MANTEKVKIVYSVLKQQVEELGWKAEQVSEHYGLNRAQVKSLMQKTGLNFRKKAPAFEIIMDEEQEEVETVSSMNKEVVTQAETILTEAQNPFKVELQDLPQGEQMGEVIPLETLFKEEVKETPTINQFWK